MDMGGRLGLFPRLRAQGMCLYLLERLGCTFANCVSHSNNDIIKSILVGADAVMMASSLIEGGPDRLSKQLDELQDWLTGQGVSSVGEIKGVMRHAHDESHIDREERSNYLRALVSYANRWRAEHA